MPTSRRWDNFSFSGAHCSHCHQLNPYPTYCSFLLIGDVKCNLRGLSSDMGHFWNHLFSLQIREESNTKIDLPAENSNSETIVITGKRANCEAARHRILAIQKELVSDLLWTMDLKMIEYINTQEIVVVWNSREETNRSVSLFLTLKSKVLAKVASNRREEYACGIWHFFQGCLFS